MLAWNELLTDLAWHEILHRHFRPSQSRKWITALWMINSWQTWSGCVRKVWKTPSSQPILLYFEFRSRPSLITGICMDPHSPNKSIVTKYCFLILGDDTSFFFSIISLFFFSFLFLLFYVILLLLVFTKIILLLLFYFYFFFHENYFYFFMFRDIPGCSGIFRVPGFIDALCSRKIDDFRKNFDLSWHCVGRLTRPERNLRNLFRGHGLKYINCSNKSIIYIGFLMNNNSKNILFRYYVC